MFGTGGLTQVSTDDLKTLLTLVHRGELECPITEIGLAICGQLRLLDDIEALHGLDKRAVHTVLVCVLKERLQTPGRRT